MQKVMVYILAWVFLTSSWAQEGVNFTSGGKLNDNQAGYDIISYDIHIEVDADSQKIGGFTDIILKTRSSLSELKFDLVDHFTVTSILFNGIELDFDHENHQLTVFLTRETLSEVLTLRIFYHGKPPVAPNPPWTGGFTWAKDSLGNDWIGVSCPNEGAKIYFPCKDHPSDRPDSVGLHITVPKDYYCAANGLLEKTTVNEDSSSTFHWKTRYPISNYNINITIAKFEVVEIEYETIEGHKMPVIFYVLPEARNKAEQHLAIAVDNLSTLEKYYGEYPFYKEKFGLAHTPYLGMEHQTINAYGNDFNYTTIQGKSFDWLMLHEMGHEWWANKVSVKDWSDYWIHEGICSYGDALYILHHFGEQEYFRKMEQTRNNISNDRPVIPKRNASTDEVYQGDIYSKGAYVMHSLRFIMGDELFYKTLKAFVSEPEYTYHNLVASDDIIAYFDAVTAYDLMAFMQMYLYTTELIEVRIEQLAKRKYRVTIPNIDFRLPIEIRSDEETEKYDMDRDGIVIKSGSVPEIDPNNWYLRKGYKGVSGEQ